jgi:hypothetical protein
MFGGCAPETPVATPSQFNIARTLQAHDHILCRTNDGTTVTRPIEMIKQQRVNEVIHLEFGNDELDVAVDQKFLVADKARFMAADQLTTDHRLVNINGEPVAIDRIERRHGTYSLVTFSVNEFHTFFVTQQGIVLHNNIAYDYTAKFETQFEPASTMMSEAIIANIPVNSPLAGVIVIGGCIYHAKDYIGRACRAIGRGFAWLFGKSMSIGDEMREMLKKRADAKSHIVREIDQMAAPEPDDNGIYRVYEPSPKHYPTPHPGANLGPGWVEGQLALNASWFVSNVEGRETRLSYWGGKMITFKFTQQIGKFRFFHGFYEYKVEDLRPPSFEVLRKNGVINHRGKFLK